tara:strand:- start:1168 stop:2106 length:939 start_codon:yes stop_codon:yes gene_type:complete
MSTTPCPAQMSCEPPTEPTAEEEQIMTPQPAQEIPIPQNFDGMPRCDTKGGRMFWAANGGAAFSPQIGPNRIFGTDWSGWNAPNRLPYPKLKSEGVEFAIIKLTQGTSKSNKYVENQIAGARANGIKIGSYHFTASQKSGDAEQMADREFEVYKREIRRHGKFDLTPALDFEHGRTHLGRKKTGPDQEANSTHNLKFYIRFCKRLRDEFKVKPLVYTAAWARSLFMDPGMKGTPLWRELGQVSTLWWAEYDRTMDQTLSAPLGGKITQSFSPWSSYDIWQYSGWGRFQALRGVGKFDFNSMKKSSVAALTIP